MESIKLAEKTYKSGIVVIFSPNSGYFRRFQSKLTKIEIENAVKQCQNKKTSYSLNDQWIQSKSQ